MNEKENQVPCEMICPFLSAALAVYRSSALIGGNPPDPREKALANCKGVDCALYCHKAKMCSIRSLAEHSPVQVVLTQAPPAPTILRGIPGKS